MSVSCVFLSMMMRPSCDDSEVCVCRGGVVNFHVFVFRRIPFHFLNFGALKLSHRTNNFYFISRQHSSSSEHKIFWIDDDAVQPMSN